MAVFKELRNYYRALDAQLVTAYCVARISEFNLDAQRCVVRLDAYDGACTKTERATGQVKTFTPSIPARQETITGALFDEYFSVTAMTGSNLIRQAYLCSCRSVIIDGVETNEWANCPSDEVVEG